MPSYAIDNDAELKSAVRDGASYDNTADELPGSQLEGVLNDAKRDMHIKTGSDKWYSDMAYGQALKAHACILAKAAVENINIASYSIGDESVRLRNADPEDSQQIQNWASQVSDSLSQSNISIEDSTDLSLSNTGSYIG